MFRVGHGLGKHDRVEVPWFTELRTSIGHG